MSQQYGITKLTAGIISTATGSSPKSAQAGYNVQLNSDGCVDSSLLEPNKFQTKYHPNNVTGPALGGSTPLTGIQFNNLIVGKTYGLFGQWSYFFDGNSSGSLELITRNGTYVVNRHRVFYDNTGSATIRSFAEPIASGPFIATSNIITTLLINTAASTLTSNGTSENLFSYLTLVEYNYPTNQVTDFT